MENKEILCHYESILNELKNIYEKVSIDNKIDLSEDKYYLGLTFVSKINGLNQIFSNEFIKEFHLEQVVSWIDKKTVMIQATHYTDKNLFYEFFNVIYPQLLYRYQQIKHLLSLSLEERKLLIITPYYQVFLYQCLKDYLELETSEENQKKMKEILSYVNLYQICTEEVVCLGSNIVYQNIMTNEIKKGKIVLPSNEDESSNKLSIIKYKDLIGKKKSDIVLSLSICILEIDNNSKY